MATFQLTIELGNEAMQTGSDIADALRTAVDRLDTFYGSESLAEWSGLSAGLMDANGNTVGRWEVRS